MKRFRHVMAVLLALVALCIAACSKSVEQRVSEATRRLGEADSLEAEIALGVSIELASATSEVSLPFQVLVQCAVMEDPALAKFIFTMELYGFEQEIMQLYFEQQEDGSGVYIMYDAFADAWEQWVVEEEFMNNSQPGLLTPASAEPTLFRSMEIVGTQTIDGEQTDVVECLLDIQSIYGTVLESYEAMLRDDALEQQAPPFTDMPSSAKDIPCTLYLSRSRPEIRKLKVDLSAFLEDINEEFDDEAVQGFLADFGINDDGGPIQVRLTELYIEVTLDNIDAVEPFTIPRQEKEV